MFGDGIIFNETLDGISQERKRVKIPCKKSLTGEHQYSNVCPDGASCSLCCHVTPGCVDTRCVSCPDRLNDQYPELQDACPKSKTQEHWCREEYSYSGKWWDKDVATAIFKKEPDGIRILCMVCQKCVYVQAVDESKVVYCPNSSTGFHNYIEEFFYPERWVAHGSRGRTDDEPFATRARCTDCGDVDERSVCFDTREVPGVEHGQF